MNNKNKNTINNRKKGFTLIEIVVILFIFSIGIMSSLSLAIRSSYLQNNKKNVITAIFLASEGLEIMKNVRDSNIILGRDYDDWTGDGSVGIGENFYKVDFNSLLPTPINSIDEAVLQTESSLGLYLHDGISEDSIFKRMITVVAEDSESSFIESWVSWESRGDVYNYKLETILYDPSF